MAALTQCRTWVSVLILVVLILSAGLEPGVPVLQAAEPATLLMDSITLEVSGAPRQPDVADVNGDTFPDILVPNYETDEVTIHLGAADGSFTPGTSLAMGDGPVDLAAADVNNDGNIDCLTLNLHAGTVSIRLGLGDGTFGPVLTTIVGNGPVGFALADLTEDGLPDILVSHNSWGGGLTVSRSRGNGSFWSPFTLSGNDHADRVHTGDLNGDGHLDVVSGSVTTFRVYIGNGNGTTVSPVIYPLPISGYASLLKLADVDEDGDLDMIGPVGYDGESNYQSLVTWPGLNDGTFGTPTVQALGRGERDDIEIADINQDGHLDVALSSLPWKNEVALLYGDGTGSWGGRVDLDVPDPQGHRLADLDGNGAPELVVSVGEEDQVNVYLNLLSGTSAVPDGPAVRPSFVAFPNPAIHRTEFRFRLDAPAEITLDLYDVSGRHLGRLADGTLPEGEHQIPWSGRSGLAGSLPAGSYFARLTTGGVAQAIPVRWLGD